MATITMFDSRAPFDAGKAVFEDLLADREVTADRHTLVHALYEAADAVAECWQDLSNEMSHAAASNDRVEGEHAIELREKLARVTEIAYGLLTTMWEGSPCIAEAEAHNREAVAS